MIQKRKNKAHVCVWVVMVVTEDGTKDRLPLKGGTLTPEEFFS